MQTITLGIIMNGVTGRMGTNQHLMRSIMDIRNNGGDSRLIIRYRHLRRSRLVTYGIKKIVACDINT